MKSMIFALLAMFIIGANAGTVYTDVVADGIHFEAGVNVSVSAGDARFNYRRIAVTSGSIFGIAEYATYSSIGITAVDGSATIDGIFGAISLPVNVLDIIPSPPPATFLAYFSDSGTISGDSHSFNFTAAGAAAAVAHIFTHIEEVDVNGNVVKTINTTWLDFGAGTVGTSATNANLHYVTYAAPAYMGATVSITVVASSINGILNLGGAVMTPKNVEVVLEISYSDYAATTNYLRITIFSAHASTSSTFTATGNSIVSGSGASQLYAYFSQVAVVDGSSQSVTITGTTTGGGSIDSIGHATIQAQLSALSGVTFDVRRVQISFPPNAAFISYDPSVGFSAPASFSPTSSSSSASTFTVSAFALLLISLALLFVF